VQLFSAESRRAVAESMRVGADNVDHTAETVRNAASP
jgi:hypothetical protein